MRIHSKVNGYMCVLFTMYHSAPPAIFSHASSSSSVLTTHIDVKQPFRACKCVHKCKCIQLKASRDVFLMTKWKQNIVFGIIKLVERQQRVADNFKIKGILNATQSEMIFNDLLKVEPTKQRCCRGAYMRWLKDLRIFPDVNDTRDNYPLLKTGTLCKFRGKQY